MSENIEEMLCDDFLEWLQENYDIRRLMDLCGLRGVLVLNEHWLMDNDYLHKMGTDKVAKHLKEPKGYRPEIRK